MFTICNTCADYQEQIKQALPKAEKEGYKFLGWAESYDAVKAKYESGAEFKENRSLELYAVWEKYYISVSGYQQLITIGEEGCDDDDIDGQSGGA